MIALTKTRITIAAAFILAMAASMMIFDAAHAASSIRVTQSTQDGSTSVRVTQSTEDGLDVECRGNLKCEIIGDDTVVATSGDNTATALNQSNIVQLGNNDLDDFIEEQDIGTKIEGMVDRLLDEIFA
jgi:hypothetical protein